MCREYKFHKGEKRIVPATVSSDNSCETVIITEATFELKTKFNEEIVLKGSCKVSGNDLETFLDFTDVDRGCYTLEVTAHVGAEKIVGESDVEIV